MLKKLRLRLTIWFSVLTSLIFIIALAITWNLSCIQYKNNFFNQFSANVASVTKHLLGTKILRDSWIFDQEISTSSIIYIEDGNTPLHYMVTQSSNGERAALVELAIAEKEKAVTSGTLNSNVTYVITDDSHRQFLCSYSDVLIAGKPSLSVWMITNYEVVNEHIKNTTISYLLLSLFGCIALTIVSFIMVSLAIAPTRESIKHQNEFIAAASHELRSPLAVIKVNLDAVNTTDSAEEQHRLLASVNKETDRLKHLTDDLLLLTGSDADALKMTKKEIYPDTLLIELYETYRTLCTRREHPLTPQLPDCEFPCIMGDSERIKQLLGIFINNALDYTPVSTPIELAVDSVKNSVIFSVIDHGNGIIDADKKSVFRRFYRSDKSRTDKNHFGLGLAVATEIAHEHSASIEICDTPGGGATFKVEFKACGNKKQQNISK